MIPTLSLVGLVLAVASLAITCWAAWPTWASRLRPWWKLWAVQFRQRLGAFLLDLACRVDPPSPADPKPQETPVPAEPDDVRLVCPDRWLTRQDTAEQLRWHALMIERGFTTGLSFEWGLSPRGVSSDVVYGPKVGRS